jgi:hypothetical protein
MPCRLDRDGAAVSHLAELVRGDFASPRRPPHPALRATFSPRGEGVQRLARSDHRRLPPSLTPPRVVSKTRLRHDGEGGRSRRMRGRLPTGSPRPGRGSRRRSRGRARSRRRPGRGEGSGPSRQSAGARRHRGWRGPPGSRPPAIGEGDVRRPLVDAAFHVKHRCWRRSRRLFGSVEGGHARSWAQHMPAARARGQGRWARWAARMLHVKHG